MKEEEDIKIVLATDDKFAIHVCACISSVIDNVKKGVIFYIIDDGISEDKWRKIKNMEIEDKGNKCSIVRVEAEAGGMLDFQAPRGLSSTTYLRLQISRVVPDDVDRIIYLDADMIVEGNIRDLWEMPLRDNSTGAVRDFAIPMIGSRGGVKYAGELGLNPKAPYLNAGILLIDLEKWRRKNVGPRALDYLETYGEEVRQADQEALNVVLADDWLPLGRHWNVPPTMLNINYWEYLDRRGETEGKDTSVPVPPAVIHFAGVHKPWMFGTDVIWQDRYFHYLRKSGWFGGKTEWVWWRTKSALGYVKRKIKSNL